ncbi:hypothetical protein PISL3812_02168 [Talaromyces islandicus]|uniref:Uncharacterized protein n=1 Tax=Talaromyces islandicus TaxID=28573 RepID=A0A0U1LQX5_TALIS|nr:hypothetical protein PISL3812_02168 [Talaromyces islandicus]
MNTSIVEKINSLYNAVCREDNMDRAYRWDDKFLSENGIRLARHDFAKPPPKDIKPMMFFARLPHYLLSDEHYRVLPHVIILSTQFNAVTNGSILPGELELILTAMKARAAQPLQEGEDDGTNFLFGREERFPVLMASIVAPSHGRILQACMNGKELLIRLGDLYSFEKMNTNTFDLFSSWLTSYPESEPDFITPQTNLPVHGLP